MDPQLQTGIYAPFVKDVFVNDELNTLTINIPKFSELGRLKFENENENLLSVLKANDAKYHNTCQSSYIENKLKRF